MMVTKVEGDRDGNPVRIYHEAGVKGRYSWVHPYDERESCDACTKGTIPADIRGSRK